MVLNLDFMVSVAILHCSILTLNIRSARYLRLSGIIANHTSFCVVDFRVSASCATLNYHCSLKSSGVVFDCRSADKKALGCLVLVGLFGGSVTVSTWIYFTSCSVTSLDNCCWFSLVALYIYIAYLPDIQTLATIIWSKRCVLNIMSSSSTIWRS